MSISNSSFFISCIRYTISSIWSSILHFTLYTNLIFLILSFWYTRLFYHIFLHLHISIDHSKIIRCSTSIKDMLNALGDHTIILLILLKAVPIQAWRGR
jgi:hypothetical protein